MAEGGAPGAKAKGSNKYKYTTRFVSQMKGVTIEVLQGEITDEATDAIVNPTDEKFGLTGSLSKAIVSKGGPSIERECKMIGYLKDVALTSGGSLKSKHIIHVRSPGNTAKGSKVLRSLLNLCASKHLRSLSILLIGVSRGIPIDQLAACITEEVANEARSEKLGSLRLVRLVGFNVKEKDAFESALRFSSADTSTLLYSSTNALASSTSKLYKVMHSVGQSFNRMEMNGIIVEVVQGDISCESTDAIMNPTDEDFGLTGNLSKAIIAKGGEAIAQECKKFGKLKDVAITSAGTGSLGCHSIIHILSPVNTEECRNIINKVLSTVATIGFGSISFPPIGVSRGIPLQQVAGCITDAVCSASRSKALGALKRVRLVGFDRIEKEAFDTALKLSAENFSANGRAREGISMGNSELSSKSNSNPSKTLEVALPASWIAFDTDDFTWSQVVMKPSDADFSDAVKFFTLSGAELQNIVRIQNPLHYGQYMLEKKIMEKQYAGRWPPGKSLERRLYHGTDEKAVREICANGFDRSFCGKNGTNFGKGCYFTSDLSYSAKYTEPASMNNKRYVFVARVLVGNYQKGTNQQKAPEKQLSGEPFDATVDRENNPTIFVIFRDTRAYPEFLYEFNFLQTCK